MFTYEYERPNLASGRFSIPHPERLDAEGNQIHLFDEINIALPGKQFRTQAFGNVFNVIFEVELTVNEKTTLDTVVLNHKNNT